MFDFNTFKIPNLLQMKYSYTLPFLEYVNRAFCKCEIEVHKSKDK